MLGGLLALAHDHGDVAPRLDDRGAATAGAGVEPLHHEAAPDRRLGDVEAVDVELVIILGVGDRRLQHLADVLGDPTLVEGQARQRRLGAEAADRLGDQVQLAGAAAKHAGDRPGLVVRAASRGRFLAHRRYALFAFLSAEWPWKVRVGENSPNLWPIMFSLTITGRNLWPL